RPAMSGSGGIAAARSMPKHTSRRVLWQFEPAIAHHTALTPVMMPTPVEVLSVTVQSEHVPPDGVPASEVAFQNVPTPTSVPFSSRRSGYRWRPANRSLWVSANGLPSVRTQPDAVPKRTDGPSASVDS